MRSRSTAVSFVQTHTNLHQPFGGRPSQDSVLVTLFGAGEEELKALGASHVTRLGRFGFHLAWQDIDKTILNRFGEISL